MQNLLSCFSYKPINTTNVTVLYSIIGVIIYAWLMHNSWYLEKNYEHKKKKPWINNQLTDYLSSRAMMEAHIGVQMWFPLRD